MGLLSRELVNNVFILYTLKLADDQHYLIIEYWL